ncbi:MAG TPA: SDR family oxidoreductase [Acidimicrobiia bacterium]|nr:SDR family oxidoreductase [Acidimicrobiia bacterium]
MRLAGERALITGSTSGIGRAIAQRFAEAGAVVCVTGRDRVRGDAVVAQIDAAGGVAHFVPAELRDEDACTALVEHAAERIGGLTILVNNAAGGDGGDGPIGDITTEAWNAILTVNLTAPMWLTRAAIAHLLDAGHGSIVNISTRQAERASRGFAAYIASKGGLNALTRSIAVDYADRNIRCNTISPGYVLNDRRDADIDDDRRARYEGMHLTRLGVADDIAYAAVYLASRESDFVTGLNLQVDGGSSIARGLTLG